MTLTSLPPAPRLPSGYCLANRYRIERVLGHGGDGVVYLADDLLLQEPVALKTLSSQQCANAEHVQQLRDELLLARRVSHPNVVRVHDLVWEREQAFLCMGYLPGGTLADRLARDGPLAVAMAIAVIRQLTEGLAAVHQQGIAHRDLKPSNVLFSADGRAILADFGIAGHAPIRAEYADSMAGTIDYLAPEQRRGQRGDARSDLYALGLILHETLSGELPSPTGQLRLPATIPASLRGIVSKLLAVQPARRYRNTDQLLNALSQWQSVPHWRRYRIGVSAVLLTGVLLASAWWLGAYRFSTWWYGDVSPAPTAKRALAVLPVVDETAQSHLSWTSTGLAELFHAALSEQPSLRLPEPQRVAALLTQLGLTPARLTAADRRQLSELLAVDQLVLAQLRQLDHGYRLDVQLLDHNNTDTPTRRLHATAAQLNALLAQLPALAAQLLQEAPATIMTQPIASAEALAAYHAGWQALQLGDTGTALSQLQRAMTAAPKFALAGVALAEAWRASGQHEQAVATTLQVERQLGADTGHESLQLRARLARLSDRQRDAIALLQQLLQRYPHDNDARQQLAEALAEQGDFAAAQHQLQLAVADDGQQPRLQFLLGKYAILQGQYRSAIEQYLSPALRLYSSLRQPAGQADVANAMGLAYRHLGELDHAEQQFLYAIDLRQQLSDWRGLTGSLINLATVAAVRGDYSRAQALQEQAAGHLRRLDDKVRLAELYNEQGVLAEERGRYADALNHYRDALQLRRELSDQRALAESFSNVGYSAFLRGDYDSARAYLGEARQLHSAIANAAGTEAVQLSLAQLHIATGEWNSALSLLHAVGEKTTPPPVYEAVWAAQLDRAELARLQGRWQIADEMLRAAEAGLAKLDDARGHTEAQFRRADLLLDVGDGPALLALSTALMNQLRNPAHPEQATRLQLLQAQQALVAGDDNAARAGFKQVLAAAEQGDIVLTWRAHLGLADCAMVIGDWRSSEHWLAAASAAVEQSGNVPLRLQLLQRYAALAIERGQWNDAAKWAEQGLRWQAKLGPYALQYRFHSVQLRAARARGHDADLTAQRATAQTELSRMLAAMTPSQQRSFLARPDVSLLMQELDHD